MPQSWRPVPLDRRMFTNVNEAIVGNTPPAIENLYVNDVGGFSRFPGMESFVDFGANAPVYLAKWRGDIVAVCAGRVYRVDPNAETLDVTGVLVAGSGRTIFSGTESELLMCAGETIVRLGGEKTDLLSEDAPPRVTHVGYIDGYVMAIERDSGRFWWNDPTDVRSWDGLDTLSADGNPDNLNGLLITPFRELILTGLDSTEQFERLASGDTPFFRRWATGEGNSAPSTLIAADNAVYLVNDKREFVRSSGQVGTTTTDDVQVTLEKITDWTDAWATEILIKGQKCILLQCPRARTVYDTKGVTLVYDIRRRYWSFLFGWDEATSQPACWPGRSYLSIWDRRFVGGANGKIYELKDTLYRNDGLPMRAYVRTGNMRDWGPSSVLDVQLQIKRGNVVQNAEAPLLGFRARIDQTQYTRWRHVDLGLTGKREQIINFGPIGDGSAHQFEFFVTDDSEVEIVRMDALVQQTRRRHG